MARRYPIIFKPPAVLLVDDNETQAATRCTILARAGNDVSIATSGANALLAMGRPDYLNSLGLVITDHFMPGMNGPEFVRAIRRIAPRLPILVVSGLPEAEAEYDDSLNVVFRVKPFAPEQLILLVRSLLEGPISLTA